MTIRGFGGYLCSDCNLPAYRCCCPLMPAALDDAALNELMKKPAPLTFVPAPAAIVSMVVFKDKLYVATTDHVYYMVDDKLHRIEFAEGPFPSAHENGPAVVDNRLFYKLKDGSSVLCECIADPVASQIVDLWRNR